MADRPPNYPGEQGPGIDHTAPPVSPDPPIREGAVSENTKPSDLDQTDADISHKQFRFNPPLHSSNMSKVVDMGGSVGSAAIRTANFYDEKSAPAEYTEKWSKEGLNTLRLGRIIQHHLAPGPVSQMQYRWGFRFLYNPTTVSYVSSRNDSFIIDPRSESNQVLSGVFQNFQSVSFTVLLDRVPDVMSGIPDSGQYSPSLRKGDRDGILRYGTHWDTEALLKICNGEWNLTDRGKTSNMGVLMPSNARLILGPGVNFYGFVGSVTWKDELFSANMVPIRTRLDLVFRRHVDMTAEEAAESFPGIATVGDANQTEGGDDSGGDYGGDSIGNNRDAPLPGRNRVTTGFYGYTNHNGWDYAVPTGTPVHATHSGKVERIRHLTSSYGKHVFVRYGDVQMIYAHLNEINSGLREGMSITSGTYIGKSGNTGNSSGPHLHYEERVGGKSRIPEFANNTGRVR